MSGYTIDMIDVGQGDAFIVAGGKNTCLIDVGPRSTSDSVIQHINKHFDGQISAVLLTHVDDDHIGGLEKVLKAGIKPRIVFVNDPASVFEASFEKHASAYASNDIKKVITEEKGKLLTASVKTQSRILDMLCQRRILHHTAFAGKRIRLTDELHLKILSPSEEVFSQLVQDFTSSNLRYLRELVKSAASSAENSSSIVLEAVYEGERPERALFTGDAGIDVLEHLATRQYAWVKIPHHGSRSGLDATLLAKWKPKIAALSHGSRYDHPAPAIMNALRANKTRIYCTRCHGTVRFRRAGAPVKPGWERIESACHCKARKQSSPVRK